MAAAEVAPSDLRALCLMLVYLWVRISEALALTAADVQLTDSIVAVRCLKKRGKLVIRELPAAPALLSTLEAAFGISSRQTDPAIAGQRLWT